MLTGVAVSGGFAIGKIWKINEQRRVKNTYYRGAEQECRRFEKALARYTERTRQIEAGIRRIVGEREAAIFNGHICMAHDPEMQKAVRAKIAGGFNAETAAESACQTYIEDFLRANDDITCQRAADIKDMQRSFVSILSEQEEKPQAIPVGSVIAAKELTPSAVTFLERRRTVAVLTEQGGRNAHLAILLRAMGIPAVFSVKHLMAALENGQKVIVDGNKGEVVEV